MSSSGTGRLVTVTDQLSLLNDETEPAPPEGLIYVDDFVSEAEEAELLHLLDVDHVDDWLPDLLRRVQHYGYKYDYRQRRVDRTMELGPLPDSLRSIADRIAVETSMSTPFDQAIVNEYEPGQGIAEHIDCEPCFGDMVATLSLGSDIEMQFGHRPTGGQHHQRLRRRSLAILSGPARYEWTHSIAKRKSDRWGGPRVPRERRVSITFRTVLLSS